LKKKLQQYNRGYAPIPYVGFAAGVNYLLFFFFSFLFFFISKEENTFPPGFLVSRLSAR